MVTQTPPPPPAPPREPQPGGRRPAPGRLALLQSFLNSRWDLDGDHGETLRTPERLAGWLGDRELLEPGARLTEGDLRRALEVREGLRALLFVNNGADPDVAAIARLDRALDRCRLSVRLAPGAGSPLVPAGGGLDGALARLAAIAALAEVDGSWSRLKACRGDHCGWAFYDHSRNGGGSWCSMSTCGARSKARRYRRRRKAAERA